MAINKFQRGSAVFKCNVCGRNTRLTSSHSVKLCSQCFDLAGIENEISDGHCTYEERKDEISAFLADITAKGGDVTEWDESVARMKTARTGRLKVTQ